MSHPWIARPNKQHRRAAPERTLRLKQMRLAMLLALSGSLLWQARPVQAAAPLPVSAVPVADPTSNVASFGNATLANPNATTLRINQTSDKAIINWNSFDIDAGHTVDFKQPGVTSVALNRIGGSAPSTIAGNLTANGQIYLINTNGILFATGATVNVNALTASTLDISDQLFKDGILSASKPTAGSQLTPVFTAQGGNGDIHIQPGAALSADPKGGGRIMIIAPNVDNQGVITAPDGQIILAAGAKVYLQASDDPNLRGLLVEVDSGGSAQNLGQLLAQHGNITLVGMDVTQGGTARATTSVSANGSIYLLAEDSAVKDATRSDTTKLAVTTTETGTVTLATGSITEVTPDLSDTGTAVDEQVQAPSTVTAEGGVIHMANGSRITATSGQVTLSALANPSDPTVNKYGAAANGSHVYLDAGSKIDVSGSKVVLPMDHNLVKVDLRANELADAPRQRNGVLRGRTVTVDARVGTPLANVKGAIAAIGRTVAERTTTGGTVNLQSEGDVVVQPGATIDVSGGWKQFQAGYLNTTRLISRHVIYDIGSADPNRVYSGIARNSLGRFVPSYIEGSNAGTAQIVAHNVVQDGALLGVATAGTYQRGLRPTDPKLCDLGCQATTRPLGGKLILGDSTPSLSSGSSGAADYILGDVSLDDSFATLATTGGFTRLSIFSNGRISLPAATALDLGPGGALNLTGQSIDLSGNVMAAGGAVSLKTGLTATEQAGDNNDLVIGEHARIDVRGVWANDLQQGVTVPTPGPTVINGGSVSLASAGNLSLGTDSLIDVSGGAWVNSAGALSAGKGGNITLGTTQELRGTTLAESAVSLGGTLRGYAPGAGGRLRISANSVLIGSGTDVSPVGTLKLDPEFFQQGGFGDYVVTANAAGLTVVSGSTLAPLARNLQLNKDYALHATGSDIYAFSHLVTLPNGQRTPVNLTLQSNNSAARTATDQTGVLSVGAGARISGDTGASLSLLADKRIDMEGVLAASAGTLTLRLTPPTNSTFDLGFDATQSLWLGAESALLAAGTTVLTPNALNMNLGQVLSGGTVTLDAQRGYVVAQQGARIDVSGTTGQLDLVQANGGYQRTAIASAGGKVNINSAEGVLWGGTVQAQSGAPGTLAGGSLNVTLSRANVNVPTNGAPFPDTERRIVINDGADNVPPGLRPGDAVDSSVNGQALIDGALLGHSGFDNVTLASDQTIAFQSDPALSVRGRLILNAPHISVADKIKVHLDADYLALGASENSVLLQQRASAPDSAGGTLIGHAKSLIELVGDASWNGDAQLTSDADLRLRGVLASSDSVALTGSLQTNGAVTLTADQVYATTFSNYTIDLLGTDSTLTVNPNAGHTPSPPLSAGSTLTVNAPNITNNGILKAPLGTINLNAGDTLLLASNSITSTSAQGQLIPFGMTQNGTDWVYDYGNGKVSVLPAPPEKRINLNAAHVDIAAGAVVDLSGGGDLYGYEFIPGPGGSKDVLDAATAPGTYAVLPSMNGTIAPFDQQYYQGSGLQVGDAVYLSGGGGLAAGVYTLLPARYALLPGAYLVTAVAGYQDLPATGIHPALLNGATVVAGYRTQGDTGLQADQRWSGFAVQSVSADNGPRAYSEYTDSYASKFFTASAARLPQDAGNLAINTSNSLLLNGVLTATAAAGGRGAQVDIVAPELSVVNSIDAAGSGVQLTANELNNLGAESLLLGATRHTDGEDTLLDVGANDVTIGANVHLTGPELLLAAQDKVTVASGAQLSASGKLAKATADTLIVGRDSNGDGALLRLSVGPQAAIRRENTQGNTGALEVQANTTLSTTGSLALDATRSTESSGTLDVTGALSLGAARINLGAVDSTTSGLNLTNTQLADFTGLTELLLRSYSTVDLYGAAVVGAPTLNTLGIEAAGLRGFANAGTTATLAAGTVTLSNPGKVAEPDAASGSGALQVRAYSTAGHGGDLNTGAGDLAVSGYSAIGLTADKQIAVHDSGSLKVSGDVSLSAPRLTAAGGSDYTINADGHQLTVSAPASASAVALAAAPGAGKLALKADTIDIAGRVELPAGQFSATATNGVSVASGAFIGAIGVAQNFNGQMRYMPGGSVALSTTNGDITIASNASIDVSGASAGGDAGQLSLSAAQGAVQVDGTIHGQAAAGYKSGSLSLDTLSLSDFSAWNTRLNSSGFTHQVKLRARSHDVTIGATDVVHAREFALNVDQGALDVAGTIDASGSNGGQISLSSSDTLTVQSGALLDAHATAALGEGGSVSLQTGDSGSLNIAGGTINVSPGYTATQAGVVTAAGAPGHVYLRAPRLNNDVAIAALNAAFTNSDKRFAYPGLDVPVGLVDITAEAYRAYSASTIDSSLIDTITTDNAAYMANQAAITDRLGMTGNAQFHFTPGVEVRSSGDLTLASDWNLYQDGRDYNGGVAGVLTLRAAGNLNIDKSLSDGFSTVAPDADFNGGLQTVPVTDADGNPVYDENGDPVTKQISPASATWSYRLIGGADLASADPLAVQSGVGDVTIGSDQLVRTGNGRIDVAAGKDIVFTNQNSVLYTAGTRAASLSGFTDPPGSNYATAGGDITLAAQHDVVGAITGQMISDWIYRQGQLNTFGSGTIKDNTTWWLSFKDFKQNVGALGGGNISVSAGNDVTNLSAVIPTTGRRPDLKGQLPDASVPVDILGGGNLRIDAGRHIDSGIFYVGKGTGTLRAGGALGSARAVKDSNPLAASDSTPLYTVLAVADGRFDVLARGNATLESIINPTVLPQANNQPSVQFGSLYYTYSPASAANVQSLAGNVIFDNNGSALAASLANLPFLDIATTGLAKQAAAKRGADSSVLLVYPGSLLATAFQGDIISNNTLTLYPAPTGDLQFMAGGNVQVAAVNLSDTDAGLLPTPAAPATQYRNKANDAYLRLTTNPNDDPKISALIHALVPVHDQPGNADLQPARIVAGGDIQGAFYLAKAVQMQAGQDILNLTLQAQNLRATDISSVVAGGNISYTLARQSDGTLQPNTDTIEVGGPGSLQVQAGGNIDLGASTGIRTTGNNFNPALPSAGADITVAAGVTTPPDYNGFVARYLDPAGPATTYKYVAELTAYMQQLLGDPQLSDAVALSGFRTLDAAHQQAFLLSVYYAELRATGRTVGTDYQRGYDAISSLFPGDNYHGDLSLPFSQIKTLSGGNINLLVPGGLVNAGVANPPANLGDIKTAADLGIVAQGTGSISAFTKGDFLVNQSRVFTLQGGNILMWSSDGNIDAGRGAKTAISAPPPVLTTDANGNTVFTFQGAAQGSGIRVILTSTDATPGDVDLIAPRGEVNAGDAGIGAAGNLNIAALRVVGADNIQVAGVSSGVPSESAGLSGGLAGVSNLAGEGNSVADTINKNIGAGDAGAGLAYLSVDVLGFGDNKADNENGGCKPGDEKCSP